MHQRKIVFSVIGIVVLFFIMLFASKAALGMPSGITGYSGNPLNCSVCHGGGVDPTVTLTGPTSVAPGSTNMYTLTISGGQRNSGALDVSVTSGTLASIAGQGTKLQSGQIVHTARKAVDAAGNVSFNFNWTAPASGSATIYGAGLSANGDGTESGDGTTNATRVVTIAAPTTYTLTYTAGANGSISGTTPQTVASGASGTAVTAVPNTGYHFVNWTPGGSTANPRTDTGVTGNISVTANFAINSYTLTYSAGANGSISGTTPQIVNHGASGTAVTAVPAAGYHFVNWTPGGSTANPRTDSGVTADISVTANFAINTYTLTYTAGANGSISGTTPQTVASGASGTAVTAVPAAGYHFVNWTPGASTANPRTDSGVTADISVTANFAINTYTLIYTAGANGSISGTTPQTVNHGASGTAVTAVPAAGYHFVNWTPGGLTSNPRIDSGVTADISVTANFAINTYTLTYTAGANGSISGTTPQTVNHGASGTAVTAVPAAGYHFVNWTPGGSTANPRTDTGVTGNISVTANFAINTYTLTYTAGANGSISGTTPQIVNHGASGTAVTAMPAAGYHFVNWTPGGSTANPRTDSGVTADISVTANFAINTYTLTYTAGANGSISGTTPQTVNHGSNGTAVTAVPAAGYHFVNWTPGGSTVNPRTDSGVTADISVTANFAIDEVTPTTYTLTYTAGANGSISGTTPQTVASGASGTAVTAVPAAGYHFVNWTPGGSTANPRTDSGVTADISVTANFAINTYTLTYTAGANGSISGTTPQTVNHGASGTAVTAVPAAGYHFVNWTPGASTANPRTDSGVTANISVTANFAADAPITYTITATAGANGTISPSGAVTVNSGASRTFTIAANAGYHISGVLVDGISAGAVASYTFNNVTANHTIIANFAVNTSTTKTYNILSMAGRNGSISPSGKIIVNSGANQTFTITANAGYHISNVWVDTKWIGPVSSYTFSNITANHTIVAMFDRNRNGDHDDDERERD